jgi:hypothetical protein
MAFMMALIGLRLYLSDFIVFRLTGESLTVSRVEKLTAF